ncbi:MAG: host attachment protein [Myxococcaceae bacterium]
MKKQQRTWIVVADASRGRIFLRGNEGEPWSLIQEHANPEARSRSRDEQADNGRFQQSEGAVEANGMEPLTVKDVESRRFAEQLIDMLSKSVNLFEDVGLVAPPKFLGLLRQQLSPSVKRKVLGTFAKDFTHYESRELAQRMESLSVMP